MFSQVVNELMLLMIFLLIGFAIREVVKPLQKLFIPAGIIGGAVALILGPQVLGLIEIPETWAGMATPTINIVLTCTIFGTVINKGKIKSYAGAISVIVLTYFSQLFVGMLTGMGLTKIWTDLPKDWGIMSSFCFWGGHGAATTAGTLFEEYGEANMLSMGIILATLGLILAMVLGMILVNIGVRKGWAKANIDSTKGDGGALPQDQRKPLGFATVSSTGINSMALQFCFVMLSMFLGKQLFAALAKLVPFFSKIPSLLYGIVGAAIVWTVMRKTGLDRYADKKSVDTISGLALEICIISATATLNLKIFASYLVPIVIYTVILMAMMFFIAIVVVKRWIKKDWFELTLMAFGQGIGSTPSGLALARCVDPDTKTSAWEAFGVALGVFTPITSTLAALLPMIAVKSSWSIVAIGGAVTLAVVLFGELVLRKQK